MNINDLNDTIRKKISNKINIDEIIIEDKTFLHLKHKNGISKTYTIYITCAGKGSRTPTPRGTRS